MLVIHSALASTLNFNGSFQLLDQFGVLVSPEDTNVTGRFDYDFSSGAGNGGQFNSGIDLLGSPWQTNDVSMSLNADRTVTANMVFDWGDYMIPTAVVFGIQVTSDSYI